MEAQPASIPLNRRRAVIPQAGSRDCTVLSGISAGEDGLM